MITARQLEKMLSDYGEVLTVKEVMEVLHLGEKTVRKMLREGIIPSMFFGEQYIIPKVHLIDFLTDEKILRFIGKTSGLMKGKVILFVYPQRTPEKGDRNHQKPQRKTC